MIFNIELENVAKILEVGSSEEKIRVLESLTNTDDAQIIQKVVSMLDDDSIKVRGEAFSCLVLNEKDILQFLIQSLNSPSKNIRGFGVLVLANRGELGAVPEISRLTADEHPMVRACAVGALGHLNAQDVNASIRRCLTDPDMEVKKSAIKAAIDIGESLSEKTIQEILQQKDSEVEKLVEQARNSQKSRHA